MADPYNAQTLSSFQGAQERTDAQRKALLDAVATGGTAGAQAYQQQQAQNQAMRQQAVANAQSAAQGSPLASSVPGGQQTLQMPALQDAALRQQELGQAQQTLDQDLARQTSSGEDYFARLQQAIPVTENRTRMGVEQIIREQEEAARQRALEQQMAEMSLQAQRESIAAQREDRAFQKQMREQELAAASAAESDPMSDLNPLQKLQYEGLSRENQQNTENDALLKALSASGGLDAQGNPTARGAAIESLINGGVATGLGSGDASAVRRGIESYYRALGQEMTIATGGFGSWMLVPKTEGSGRSGDDNRSRSVISSAGSGIVRGASRN